VAEQGGTILFLRRLVPGPSDRSYGIEVARLAGVPHNVVQRARHILEGLEKSRAGASREHTAAIRNLLPGLQPPPDERAAAPRPEANVRQDTPHPLLTTLRDLDLNHVTPMRALELLNEWKLLWGEDV
jgi:DNA mismatch repair protein MutS